MVVAALAFGSSFGLARISGATMMRLSVEDCEETIGLDQLQRAERAKCRRMKQVGAIIRKERLTAGR